MPKHEKIYYSSDDSVYRKYRYIVFDIDI